MGQNIRIMSIKKWFKKQVISISLAMSGVEKNAFGQNGGQLDSSINQERKHTQGTLADSLKEGRITQEVMNLRWRTYKILKASEGLTANIDDYDKDGMPITSVRKVDKKKGLNKIKVDTFDKYTLIMVVDNTPIVTSGNDAMDNENIIIHQNVKINYDDDGNITSATHGEISGDEYYATTKADLPIKIDRETTPKFEIETYTKRLNIRMVDKTKRLLEFYVSKYPDEYDRRSRFFISDVKKAIEDPRTSSMLDIKKVSFVTYKTIGSDDFLEYQYSILNFDKIIEFNGYYVIKFMSEIEIDGTDILNEHRVEELDEKYNNKERKKQ
jgi:hypothetical protein